MTTPDYFGWHDSNPKTTDAMRLEQASIRYQEKYGQAAVNAVVHATQRPVTMPLACAGMTIDTTQTWPVKNCVYIEKPEVVA